MIIAVLLAAGLTWWLHQQGVLLPNLRRLAIVGGTGVVVVRLLAAGQVLLAVAAMAALAGWWWLPRKRPATLSDTEAEARAVLGVAPSDDAAAINAAWRRVIAQVHPDKGGTADLAHRVTAARDYLIARASR